MNKLHILVSWKTVSTDYVTVLATETKYDFIEIITTIVSGSVLMYECETGMWNLSEISNNVPLL